LAELVGKLVNVSYESDVKGLVSDGLLKALISGDPITVERKNQHPFVFRNGSKLIFCVNTLPKSADQTHAFFRRFIVILFEQRFEGSRCDPKLKEKIVSKELDGILNWMIVGLNDLRNNGFVVPDAARAAHETYKRNSNPAVHFVDDCLKVEHTFNVTVHRDPPRER
jgi:putative DNA primase/helicase